MAKKDVIPGEALKKVDADAHKATYDKDGDLAIRHTKPVAAVEGGEKGTADTGVSAKIQEPVSGETVNPSDTVDSDVLPEHSADKPETTEVRGTDQAQVGDGEQSASSKKAEELKEETLDSLDVDKTEAAKNAEKSQAKAKADKKTDDK